MEATADALGACARHSDRSAAMACVRCGNFACAECLGPPDRTGYGHCADCREREGFAEIPWEATDAPWWRRYAATVRLAIGGDARVFGSLGSGDVGRSMSFAALSSLLGFSPLVLLFLPLVVLLLLFVPELRADSDGPEPGTLPVLVAAVPCAIVFYPALSFAYFSSIGALLHLVASLLGGRASFGASLRAAYYTSAWEAVSAAVMVVYCVPILGVLLVLGASITGAVLRARALRAFAEHAHGLSGGSATVAGAIAAGFWMVIWLSLLVVAVGLAIWQRSH